MIYYEDILLAQVNELEKSAKDGNTCHPLESRRFFFSFSRPNSFVSPSMHIAPSPMSANVLHFLRRGCWPTIGLSTYDFQGALLFFFIHSVRNISFIFLDFRFSWTFRIFSFRVGLIAQVQFTFSLENKRRWGDRGRAYSSIILEASAPR